MDLPNSAIDLVVHISLDFIRGASIEIEILLETIRATTGLIIPCDLESARFAVNHQNEIFEQARLETPEDAQMFALESAVALSRETIRDYWPRDVPLARIKFRIGLKNPSPSHCIAASLDDHIQRRETRLEIMNEEPARLRSVFKQISLLRADMVDRLDGRTKPTYFEDQEERMSAVHTAKQKHKTSQSSPRWGVRGQRQPA